ncbi:hypothetical protein AYO44_06675 [Planctomycetaceae bacterium SCGC AG-212-F19]|nr:hypothetical protein AYO44_06675 [Planctomycetaceae bacterium SCGC AG-212-F19]
MTHDDPDNWEAELPPQPDPEEPPHLLLSWRCGGVPLSFRFILLGILASLVLHAFCLPFVLSVTVHLPTPIFTFTDRPNPSPITDDLGGVLHQDRDDASERTVAAGSANEIASARPVINPVKFPTDDILLPTGAEHWDVIGDYELKDEPGNLVPVRLYLFDSDSPKCKEWKRRDIGNGLVVFWTGHFFELHAMYQESSGRWEHQPLYKNGHAQFHTIQERRPDVILLQLYRRSRGPIAYENGVRLPRPFTSSNDSFTLKLSVVKGIPVIEE